LSRVLLEAAALGVPIAAMETGGTSDIVRHEETGLLSKTPDGLSRDLARLVAEPALAARLGAAARAHAEHTFDQSAVIDRTVALYTDLVTRKRHRASHA
jgi:glycosyltransferase involved in cell wall biosynthesis